MPSDLHRWKGEAANIRGYDPSGYSDTSNAPRAEDDAPPMESYIHADGGSVTGTWGEGNEDLRRPGERLAVYQCQGDFVRRDGKRRTMVHGFRPEAAPWLGEVVVKVKPMATTAAALSFMSAGPYDVRPHLLLLMYAEDMSQLPECWRYGVRYLAAWCKRQGLQRGEAAIRAAAADALQYVFDGRDRKRKRWPLGIRAKTVRLSPAAYGAMRRAGIQTYRRRLAEGLSNFRQAQRRA